MHGEGTLKNSPNTERNNKRIHGDKCFTNTNGEKFKRRMQKETFKEYTERAIYRVHREKHFRITENITITASNRISHEHVEKHLKHTGERNIC
jgi:hypothetical protein